MPENKQQKRNRRKKETMEVICIPVFLSASTAEELSVIKVLTAPDNDIAPFCSGPVTPVKEI